MPSYAHLTQFSATDPLPLTLGPVVRPATPAPAPCPLQAFERGDHGAPKDDDMLSLAVPRTTSFRGLAIRLTCDTSSAQERLNRLRAQLAAQSVQEPWRPNVGDLVDTDCGPVLRGAKVLRCRPEDSNVTVGNAMGLAFLVPKSALRPAVTTKPAAPPADPRGFGHERPGGRLEG